MFPYTAALLLAGEAPSPARLELFVPPQNQKQLYWTAADGGYRYASRYGVQVQSVLGDFDSLNQAQAISELQAEQILHFAPDKDESDRNLALQHLAQLGHKEIVQIGGGGQRSDHFLAMIYDYQRFDSLFALPRLWLTRYEAIYYLKTGEQIELHFGATHNSTKKPLISIFPIVATRTSGQQEKVRLSSKSLQWPLQDFESSLYAESNQAPYSLSNWAIQDRAVIAVESGTVLIFCPYVESRLTAAKVTLG